MGKARFRRWVAGGVSGAGCLALIACSGSSANDPLPQTASSAGTAQQTSAAAGAAQAPSSSNAGAGAGTGQAGTGHSPDTSDAGAGPTDGVSGMSGGVDFSHGARLLIPQRNITAVRIGPTGLEPANTVDSIDLSIDLTFVDGPTYPRQFEVGFEPLWVIVNHCQERKGKFDIRSLEVKQDVDGTGAHLKIEQTDGHYLLTHDGPGYHQINVAGTFRVDALPPETEGCPPMPTTAADIPVTFTTNIGIQRLASTKASAPAACGASPVMLSGRNYGGSRVSLLNDKGQILFGANVDSNYPLDVIVESEKPAQIAEGSGAIGGIAYDGLVVTGEPQLVRLSTTYGTLFTYQLANTSQIDGLDVKFWSRATQSVKSPTTALAMASTPAVASSKVLGATATLSVGGVNVCTSLLASDFEISLLSPKVCDVQYENGPDRNPGIPGFLATFIDKAGTCELEVSVPGANGEKGLATHLSSVLAAAP